MSSHAPDRAFLLPLLVNEGAVITAEPAEEPAQSDSALLARMETGEQAALSLLFDRYFRMVMGIAYRVLRDRGESEELVQDIFLYVHQNASRHDPNRGSVKAWIVQLAYYRALNRRLFLTRRRFYDGTNLDTIENNILGSADPEEEFRSRESQENMGRVFAELSPRQRMTLELFFVEGLTLREISQRIDEPLCNVRHHYYRGLKKLRDTTVVEQIRKER